MFSHLSCFPACTLKEAEKVKLETKSSSNMVMLFLQIKINFNHSKQGEFSDKCALTKKARLNYKRSENN